MKILLSPIEQIRGKHENTEAPGPEEGVPPVFVLGNGGPPPLPPGLPNRTPRWDDQLVSRIRPSNWEVNKAQGQERFS